MPENMEATDRIPAKVRDMPDDLVEQYARNAFSTPYSLSRTQKEDDEDIDGYKHEPEAKVGEGPSIHVSGSEVTASVPAAEDPLVRQSGRVKNKPDRYGFPPEVMHITVKKGLQQYGDKASRS